MASVCYRGHYFNKYVFVQKSILEKEEANWGDNDSLKLPRLRRGVGAQIRLFSPGCEWVILE
jgi:hypothetical protein